MQLYQQYFKCKTKKPKSSADSKSINLNSTLGHIFVSAPADLSLKYTCASKENIAHPHFWVPLPAQRQLVTRSKCYLFSRAENHSPLCLYSSGSILLPSKSTSSNLGHDLLGAVGSLVWCPASCFTLYSSLYLSDSRILEKVERRQVIGECLSNSSQLGAFTVSPMFSSVLF